MSNPIAEAVTDWKHWIEQAAIQAREHKPNVSMHLVEVAEGYFCQICIRKNPEKSRPKARDFLARAIIVNARTNGIVFDSGAWNTPNSTRTRLDAAIVQLDAMEAFKQENRI